MSSQILLRLVAAALLASVIGLERRLRQKPAGLRTHALVGLGAALAMIVSQYGFNAVISPGRIVLDPSRVSAQVISGIGFLGAGLIFIRQDYVRGLTTAAGIWVCAAIGLACGSGLIGAAVTTTVLSLLVMYLYAWIERVWMQQTSAAAVVRVMCIEQADSLVELTKTLTRNAPGIELVGFTRLEERPGHIAYEFSARSGLLLDTVASSLLKMPGVIDVRTELTQDQERST